MTEPECPLRQRGLTCIYPRCEASWGGRCGRSRQERLGKDVPTLARAGGATEVTKPAYSFMFARATALGSDARDARDATRLGEELLALRKRAPKAPLSTLYDRHRDKLERP